MAYISFRILWAFILWYLSKRFVDWVDDMVSVYNTSSSIAVAACEHIHDMHALHQARSRSFLMDDSKGGLDINKMIIEY